MAQNFTTDVTQWQGVDNVPTAGSENLLTSRGIKKEVGDLADKTFIDSRSFTISDAINTGLLKSDGTIMPWGSFHYSDLIPVYPKDLLTFGNLLSNNTDYGGLYLYGIDKSLLLKTGSSGNISISDYPLAAYVIFQSDNSNASLKIKNSNSLEERIDTAEKAIEKNNQLNLLNGGKVEFLDTLINENVVYDEHYAVNVGLLKTDGTKNSWAGFRYSEKLDIRSANTIIYSNVIATDSDWSGLYIYDGAGTLLARFGGSGTVILSNYTGAEYAIFQRDVNSPYKTTITVVNNNSINFQIDKIDKQLQNKLEYDYTKLVHTGLMKTDGTILPYGSFRYSDKISLPDAKTIIVNSVEGNNTDYAGFYLYDDSDTLLMKCGGWLNVIVLSDYPTAKYFRFQRANDSSFTSASVEVNNGNISKWSGKKMVWYGTSIPAGGFTALTNKNTYPYIVGDILGSKVWNEAVGSSCANGSLVFPTTYEIISRKMGHTIAEKLQIFNDCWTVDFANQTVATGPRQLGITNIPTVSTYNDAITNLYNILSFSYEIKLVAKYLLSDTEEHDAFLLNKVGQTILDVFANRHGINSFEYQGDMDIFCLDHLHNDQPTALFPDVTTRDRTTPCGAMNTFIDLIHLYKPRVPIIIISDYSDYDSSQKVLECQKQLCDYWHFPFINVCDYLPFGYTPVTTQGYWSGSPAIFHDTGFYFTYSDPDSTSWTTNEKIINSGYSGKKASEVISAFNIRTLNGIQVHDLPQRRIWFYDGLHPHSDGSYLSIKKYAQTIVNIIDNVGN